VRVLLLVLAACLFGSVPPLRAQCAPGAVSALSAPKLGDLAPDFSLEGSDGRRYRLANYRGKQPVVLVWFAKAFTGG
jgi:peroxiredoxin Q/BCP